MGIGPTQGDGKRGSDRSVHPSVTAAEVSAALPFVIPSEAEGSAVPFPPRPLLEVFFDRP